MRARRLILAAIVAALPLSALPLQAQDRCAVSISIHLKCRRPN